MKNPSKLLLALATVAAIPMLSFAAEGANPAKESAGITQKAAAEPMADGEIKKIDKDAGKITIKHGPLASLNMPPMTMVFRVKDAAMLDQVKPGDKVKFSVEKLNGALTVTAFEAVK
ncbi:RND transporter [Massilia glaciei]|uniref:RND transporter n=2 Tax=Massilia glaciei TaxID=1524097 RepID=A0A2U2HE22_9BURK|nr:RND transporter [Massilia glaciei]